MTPLLLACGHVAEYRERLRYGPEKWCSVCCRWVLETGPPSQPRLLDLCCRAGGTSMGYSRAGFEVVGIDVKPQPRYPFEFHQADALTLRQDKSRGCWHIVDGTHDRSVPCLGHFDVIHASPPCQGYSATSACRPGLADKYPKLIEPIRDLLTAWGGVYVIENVPGAPLRDPVELCGFMFGLDLYRHRLFESNVALIAPEHVEHTRPASRAGHWTPGTVMSVAGCGGRRDSSVAMQTS